MTDILKIARERQGQLRAEIAEMDDFIRMAETLLRGAGRAPARSEQPARPAEPACPAEPARAERPDAAEEPTREDQVLPAGEPETDEGVLRLEQSLRSDQPQVIELPDGDAEPMPRAAEHKFPWSNVLPPVRKSDADDSGPTRRNLMRREAT